MKNNKINGKQDVYLERKQKYTCPEKGWCSNCIHNHTDYCKGEDICKAYRGQPPTEYSPIK